MFSLVIGHSSEMAHRLIAGALKKRTIPARAQRDCNGDAAGRRCMMEELNAFLSADGGQPCLLLQPYGETPTMTCEGDPASVLPQSPEL